MKKLLFIVVFLGLIANIFISCDNTNRKKKLMSSLLSDYVIRYVDSDTTLYRACLDVESLCNKDISGQEVSHSEWTLADSSIERGYNKNVNEVNMDIAGAINNIILSFKLYNSGFEKAGDVQIPEAIDLLIDAAKESGNSQDIPGLIEMKEKL